MKAAHALSVVTLTLALLTAAARAPAAQNLNVGEPLQRFDLIKEGAHRYLRYTVEYQVMDKSQAWKMGDVLECAATQATQ